MIPAKSCSLKELKKLLKIEIFKNYLKSNKIIEYLLYLILFNCICRYQGGIIDASKRAGTSSNTEIRPVRKTMTVNGPTMYVVNTDNQLTLELTAVINGFDNNTNTKNVGHPNIYRKLPC